MPRADVFSEDYELPPLLPRDECVVRHNGIRLRIEVEHDSGRLGGFTLDGRDDHHGRGYPNGAGPLLTTTAEIAAFANARAFEVAEHHAWREHYARVNPDGVAPAPWTADDTAKFAAKIVAATRAMRSQGEQGSLFEGVAA